MEELEQWLLQIPYWKAWEALPLQRYLMSERTLSKLLWFHARPSIHQKMEVDEPLAQRSRPGGLPKILHIMYTTYIPMEIQELMKQLKESEIVPMWLLWLWNDRLTQLSPQLSTLSMHWVLQDVQRTILQASNKIIIKLVDDSSSLGLGESRWPARASHKIDNLPRCNAYYEK